MEKNSLVESINLGSEIIIAGLGAIFILGLNILFWVLAYLLYANGETIEIRIAGAAITFLALFVTATTIKEITEIFLEKEVMYEGVDEY